MVDYVLDENPYQLNSVFKTYTHDQDKGVHPSVTYRRTFRALNRAFPDKTFTLKELRVKPGYAVYDFTNGLLNSHGKGVTPEQARASAIMEFTERLSWSTFDYQHAPGYIHTSYNELSRAHDLSTLDPCFRIEYSQKKDELADLLKAMPLDWVEAYSLTRGQKTFYPVNWVNNYLSTNGLASGNSKEETILQGTCEVIERHNSVYFLLNYKNFIPEIVDNKSIQDPVLKDLIEQVESNQMTVHLLHVGQDIPVTTILCGIVQHNPINDYIKIGWGYGCHTDPTKAMIRAITEYFQGLEGLLKNGAFPHTPVTKGQWQFNLRIDMEDVLQRGKYVPASSLPNLAAPDIRDEIYQISRILAERNYDYIIVNKTHPKIKIPVYRIFIPGALPGSYISSFDENDDLTVTMTYYQSGLKEQANDYYLSHLDTINKNFDPAFHFFKQFIPEVKNVDFSQSLSKNIIPLHYLCKDTYLEQINYTLAINCNKNGVLSDILGVMFKQKFGDVSL